MQMIMRGKMMAVGKLSGSPSPRGARVSLATGGKGDPCRGSEADVYANLQAVEVVPEFIGPVRRIDFSIIEG